jgi:hypothetical protein
MLACDAPVSRARALAKAARALGDSDLYGAEGTLSVLEEHEAITTVGNLLVTLPLLPPDLRAGDLSRA